MWRWALSAVRSERRSTHSKGTKCGRECSPGIASECAFRVKGSQTVRNANSEASRWIYMVTHFVRKDAIKPKSFSMYPRQKNPNAGSRNVDKKEDAIIASALSKIVFKKGRLTIPPEVMLQTSGLLPPRPADLALLQTEVYPVPRKRATAQQIFDVGFQFWEKLDLAWEATRNMLIPEPEEARDQSRDGSPDEIATKKGDQWTWNMVEQERLRGLELASKLGELDGLAGEFTAEADALGKHSDLWWFLGLTY